MTYTDKDVVKQLKQQHDANKRCKVCGFHKHGKNHNQGEHHKRGRNGRMTPSK